MDIKTFKVGDNLTFWSDRVFGVPVRGTITKVGRKYLTVAAVFGPSKWTARIVPDRINEYNGGTK